MKPTLILILYTVFLTSCSNTDDSGIDPNATPFDPPVTNVVLSGVISENMTLDSNLVYALRGSVLVTNNAVLNIPAGTTFISSASDGLDALIIDRGAQINATGTSDAPIIFTSDIELPGQWGGIVILGNAPVNVVGGVSSPEFDTNLSYGGNNPEDSSGTLSFIRVEYAGASVIEGAVEFNGFAFYAVGSNTVINNLQAFMGADDGFEWFGGTVTANNLLSNGNEDDSFDWTEGWTGGGENWVVLQEGFGDNGIEADNNVDDNSLTAVSNPTISNITINGLGVNDGMRLRRGTAGNLSNIVISNFSDGLDIRDDITISNIQNGLLQLNGIRFENVIRDITVENDVNISGSIQIDPNATGADLSLFDGWTRGL